MINKTEIKYINKLNIKKLNDDLRKNLNSFKQTISAFKKYDKIFSNYYSLLEDFKDINPNKEFTTAELIQTTSNFFAQLSPELSKRVNSIIAGENITTNFYEPREYPNKTDLNKPIAKLKRFTNKIKNYVIHNIFKSPLTSAEQEKQIKYMRHRNSCGRYTDKKTGEVFRHIEIEPENHLSGYVRAAHELMHGCTQFNFKNGEWFRISVTGEIDSRLAERLMADYLLKNNIITSKEHLFLENSFNEEQKNKLSYVLCEYDLMQKLANILEHRDVTKKDLKEHFDSHNGPTITSLQNLRGKKAGNATHEMEYIIGSIVANKLFDDYKNNSNFMSWYEENYLDQIQRLTLEDALCLCNNLLTIDELKQLSPKERDIKAKDALVTMSTKDILDSEASKNKLDALDKEDLYTK